MPLAICHRSRGKRDQVGNAYGVERRHQHDADVLKDIEVDAVHINPPIPDHAGMSIAALETDMHVRRPPEGDRRDLPVVQAGGDAAAP